ncbi:Peptidoglycan-binding LysM [Verrucomicrobia bacterium]|nr:Peptidoglycan-binding LysM [Verrucomicrobiota bacterium]
MTWSASLFRGALLLAGCLGLSGCFPSGSSQLDEEKEPNFLAGKSHVNQMDFSGAIEAFEKASEVNPRSAAAHFELAWLFEKAQTDPAAAIYHYEQYLKLRPAAENAEVIQQHILACKQELARTVSLGPVTEKQQKEFEQLAEENKTLHDELEKWRAYYSRTGQTNPPCPASATASLEPALTPTHAATTTHPATTANPRSPTRPMLMASIAGARTHTIRAGETPSKIAREYGIKVASLMAANPQLDARRLQPGRTVAIPPP